MMDREEILEILKKNHRLMLELEAKAPSNGHRAMIEQAIPDNNCFSVDNTEWLRVGRIYNWMSAEGVTRGAIKIARKGIDRLNRVPYIDPEYGLGKVPQDAVIGDALFKGDDVTRGQAEIHQSGRSIEIVSLGAD